MQFHKHREVVVFCHTKEQLAVSSEHPVCEKLVCIKFEQIFGIRCSYLMPYFTYFCARTHTCTHTHTHTHTHTILRPSDFVRDFPGEPSPERQNQSGFTGARDSEWHGHQLGHMQICTLTQTYKHASIPPLSFL